MNEKDKSLRNLIINWQEDISIDKFNEILKLLKNAKLYSPVNESNNFKVENIVSLEAKIFIPAYLGIEKSVTNNKTMGSYTLKDYQEMLEKNDNNNIEGIIIEPDDINLFLSKKIVLDICNL